MSTKVTEITVLFESMRNEKQAKELQRFFKTREGEYGCGDKFLGIRVPQTREVVKELSDTSLTECEGLLDSTWHEVRLCALLILVDKFQKTLKKRIADQHSTIRQRDQIVEIYLKHATRSNNWDLVDLSAPKILGHWLLLPTFIGTEDRKPSINAPYKRALLDKLSDSNNLWEQRISIVSTWKTTQQGYPSWALRYSERLLFHRHDLINKAVGWMLREVGKHNGTNLLVSFLDKYADTMPRITLRYAIEKLDDKERKYWLSRGRHKDIGKENNVKKT